MKMNEEILRFLKAVAASLGRLGIDAAHREDALQLVVDEYALSVNADAISQIACSVPTATKRELQARLRAWALPGEAS